ncbi:uncharacterized protein LOC117120010 [Anneissia japonica]|uniref:uncharacterized protein LOC117120010 n=1 Tax=Anneissia japonica TaxID=1529436 RepID=UPI00142588C7|nr:uncharacterized protein LOC117120010 [Anneissia japonica]XP_033120889.1 uncharacterized protein LOC117120010 [Anneissia japonica]XP_033120890.1 uncharacterized protein LOC117120010 [Anneissia japonica]
MNSEGATQRPMISVMLMSELVKCPPSFFEIRQDVGREHPIFIHDHHKVNVCVHSSKYKTWFPDTLGEILKVHNETELESLSRSLLSKPLFLDVHLERNSKLANHRHITTGDFAVVVNPEHPVIRQQMAKILEEGKADMSAGRSFALEFEFNDVIKAWFKQLMSEDGITDSACYTLWECNHGRIVITNSSEYLHCYDVSLENTIIWMICLPCCLLTCPCYRVHRCFSCVDRSVTVQGEVVYVSMNRWQRTLTAAAIMQAIQSQMQSPRTQVVGPPQAYNTVNPPVTTQPQTAYPGYPHPAQHQQATYPYPAQPAPHPQVAYPSASQPAPRPQLPSYDEVMRNTTGDNTKLIQ